MTTSTKADTVASSVAKGSLAAAASRRRIRQLWAALFVTGVLLATGITVASTVRVPYFSFAPGNAIETEPLLEIGDGGEFFPSDGEILFLTARLGRVSAIEAFAAWIDGDIDLVPEGGVLRGLSDAENRTRQAALMTASKDTALIAAFDRLGLPLDPTGTGATVVEPPVEGSPAAAVLDVADTIVALDGVPVLLTGDLGEAIGGLAPGTTITLRVENLDGQERDESVTLAARPDDASRGFLGVTTDTRDFEPRPAFAVDIRQGEVGGPSAGLAFSLAIVDALTEGDLTGGLRVAVTGSINSAGDVGLVGGVAQKTVAASAAGASVLMVPAGEEAEALRSPHGLQIIGVATLDEAIEALERLGGDPIPARPTEAT